MKNLERIGNSKFKTLENESMRMIFGGNEPPLTRSTITTDWCDGRVTTDAIDLDDTPTGGSGQC